ncbi:TIGR00341 family protein [Methylophaga lonarensis]|uniref:TIGR00341 family protein n=1 Tax=Methylophaga lonarensis TaxID=999151 RepID=UPI003D27D89B
MEDSVKPLETSTTSIPAKLLFSVQDQKLVESQIQPLLEEYRLEVTLVAYEDSHQHQFEEADLVICYLSDDHLRDIVLRFRNQPWHLGLLPHPEMKHGRYGFGICADIEEAISDIVGHQSEQLDLLLCNEVPVFNSVVIGDAFTLSPGEAVIEPLAVRVRRFWNLVKSIHQVKFHGFQLTTKKQKELDTAALGIVAVEHGRSSVMSRRLVADSYANDGMLHALVLAPRSVFEMLRFLFASLFLRNFWSRNAPSFIGLIKTSSLTIETGKPVSFTRDNQLESSDSISLSVERRVLRLRPGRMLSIGETATESKEVVKAQALPLGKAKLELLSYPLPWMHHAATDEFKELFMIMRDSAKATPAYLTLMVLSTLLATFGLFANSIPVVIGAMILAPLMGPIVSMALGTLRQDEQLMLTSSKTIAVGTGLALLCAMALTLFIPLNTLNSEIAARISPTLLDLGVAVVSGIAGAYAHARAEVAKSLAGVAIAVALVPPLAVAGIGLGWMDFSVFWGAFLLYLTNLVGIILAALITFMFLGYSPFHRARRGLLLSLFLAALLTIPLAMGFSKMVIESRIVQQLDGMDIGGVTLTDIKVSQRTPIRIGLTLLSDTTVDDDTMDQIKQAVEARLQREVTLEIGVKVIR